MRITPKNIAEVQTETVFLLPGPAGELEVLLSAAPAETASPSIALICHPHPLHGGTMHNKVVTTLSKVFQQANMQTLRFNFRGVGKSTGSYGEGEGEVEDLYAILTWVKEVAPQASIWLAGFSFGAYISIRAAAKGPVAGLVSIAPPVNHFALSTQLQITSPWIVVQGEEDDVVPATTVFAWVETLTPKPTLIRFPNTGHFFHGKLTDLKEALIKELSFSIPKG